MKLFQRSDGKPYFADEPISEPFPTDRVRRFRYWVKRDQSFGGNLSGECTRVEIHRSGALAVHGDHGTIRRFAPGTWLECNTGNEWEASGE